MTLAAGTLDDDQLALFLESVSGSLASSWSSPLVAAEPDAGDVRLAAVWEQAAQQGWLDLGTEGLLRAGIGAMRELGRAACPLPLLDTYVAVQLLRADAPIVDALRRGRIRPVVACQPRAQERVRFADGAAAATHVLLVTSERAELRRIGRIDVTPGLARPPWSDVEMADAAEAHVDLDADAFEAVRMLLRLGLVVRAGAAAQRTHQLALQHANDRVQFGKPIGAYQAVSHRAVDGAIALAALDALVEEAVSRMEGRHPESGMTVDIAVAWGRAAIKRVQFGAHHTLAAVGYFEEHPAPWLWRRVHADLERVSLFGATPTAVADRLIDNHESLPASDLGDRAAAFREEVRDVLARHPPSEAFEGRMVSDPAVVAAFAESGYFALGWPEAYGGRPASIEEQVVLTEEVEYQRVPVSGARSAAMLLGSAILRHGTEEQRDRLLPRIARGELSFYLGYSEPEVGSDLASLRTRAVRDGDEWVIHGQKMWGTGADRAEYVWLAVRTDPDAKPRHAGITVFLAPTGGAGWELQEHRSLAGEVSCTTFFDGVRIPDSCRVGAVNDGWKVIVDALASERILMAGIAASLLRQFDDLVVELRRAPALAGPPGSASRRTLQDVAVRLQAARALGIAGIRATARGEGVRLEAPMAKILSGELAEDFGEATLELLGPEAALSAVVPGVPGGGAFEYGLRWSILNVVGGGTGDIQRNLIARALGLPRG